MTSEKLKRYLTVIFVQEKIKYENVFIVLKSECVSFILAFDL